MEAWRVVATILLGFSGLFTITVVLARIRERTGSAKTVAVSGLVSVTALAVICALTLSTFPPVVGWGLAGVTTVAIGVLVLTG